MDPLRFGVGEGRGASSERLSIKSAEQKPFENLETMVRNPEHPSLCFCS